MNSGKKYYCEVCSLKKVLLIIVLLFAVMPRASVLASNVNVIQGGIFNGTVNPELITDGDISTYGIIKANTTATLTLPTTINMTAFSFHIDYEERSAGNAIEFYNASNVLLGSVALNKSYTEEPKNYIGVKYIRIRCQTIINVKIYDVMVYATADITTPTPTPTPGPTPTATPSPTPTITPEPTPSPTPTPALEPTLDVAIAPEKIGLGKEFTADISLKNVKDIYAEDFEVKYDKEHLQYLGFEEVTGYKVYNKPVDQNGAVRFVVASQGEDYAINEDTVVIKLKFKAKAKGTAVVDSTKARIADTEEEYDLETDNCLEDSIIIEATDVNKSGTFTLVDLAIDARYFKYFAPDVDPVKYNAQQAGDEYVNDDDLLFIVDQILNNPEYLPNS